MDRIASYLYTGRMDLVLAGLLSASPDSSITEVMVHPGFPDESRGIDLGDQEVNRYLASQDRRLELNACVAARPTSRPDLFTTFAKLAADKTVVVARLSREHVTDVARLHCANVGGRLSQLGEPAVRAYYRGALRAGHLDAFVCMADGAVAGFVAGSVQPDRLKRGVLRANPLGVASSVLIGALRHPSSLRWLTRGLSGPDSGAFDASAPELTYIATTGQRRGQGVGRRLIDAFSAAMRARGVAAYELSVEEGNSEAAGFYEHLGFAQVGQYREFGAKYRRYRLAIGAAPTGSSLTS